jgi:hypothetical protein
MSGQAASSTVMKVSTAPQGVEGPRKVLLQLIHEDPGRPQVLPSACPSFTSPTLQRCPSGRPT